MYCEISYFSLAAKGQEQLTPSTGTGLKLKRSVNHAFLACMVNYTDPEKGVLGC